MPGLAWKSAWVFKPASVGSHVSPTFWRVCTPPAPVAGSVTRGSEQNEHGAGCKPATDAGWLQTSLNVEVSVGDIVGCAPRLIAGGCALACGMGCLGLRYVLFGRAERYVWRGGTMPLAMRWESVGCDGKPVLAPLT